MEDLKDLISRKELMERLQISISTIRRWEKKGILKPIHISPRKIYYKKGDLKKIIDKTY